MSTKAYRNLSSPQYEVEIQKNVFITVSDGTRLAADVYLPKDCDPTSAILVYQPYHKDSIQFTGGTYRRDLWFFARRGYVGIVVDLRGTGASEGSTPYYFNNREWQDGYDLVEWTAQQPWCNGKVGMHGHSYGGILATRTAALQPPSLKAISAISWFANIWADQFRPGGTKCAAPFSWISGPANISRTLIMPPKYDDPRYPGRMEELWLQHLKDNGWRQTLEKDWYHETYDEFWQERDLLAKFDTIKVPSLLANGWFDHIRQPDQAFLTYQALKRNGQPLKLLLYPFRHSLPAGTFAFDVLTTELAWFDHFLKGRDTGILEEDPISIFVMGENRWRSEAQWPPERSRQAVYYLHPEGKLSREAYPATQSEQQEQLSFDYIPETGKASGPQGIIGPFQYDRDGFRVQEDQRVDETGLSFTSPLLDDDLEVTGMAQLHLRVSSTANDANFCIKLLDVHPDGHTELVTRGWINLAHFKSNLHPLKIEEFHYELPEAVPPGTAKDIYMTLHNTSYVIKKGHHFRISITGSDWPHIWPAAELGQHSLHFDRENQPRLLLPIIPQTVDWNEPYIAAARAPEEIEGFKLPKPIEEDFTFTRSEDGKLFQYGCRVLQHVQQAPDQQTRYEMKWMFNLPTESPGKQWVDYHNTYHVTRSGKDDLSYELTYRLDTAGGPRMKLTAKIGEKKVYEDSNLQPADS